MRISTVSNLLMENVSATIRENDSKLIVYLRTDDCGRDSNSFHQKKEAFRSGALPCVLKMRASRGSGGMLVQCLLEAISCILRSKIIAGSCSDAKRYKKWLRIHRKTAKNRAKKTG